MFWHFIGSSTDSSNLDKLLRRLFNELKTQFSQHFLQENLPNTIEELIRGVPLQLANVPQRMVLILDGLNHLKEIGQKLT